MAGSKSNLLGIVLCGGASRRMGQNKAKLKTVDGVDFLTVAVERLEKLCPQVFVSAKAWFRSEHTLLADPRESQGPMGGVIRSLSAAKMEYEGCFFNPVDTPNLSVSDLRLLLKAFEQTRSITCAVTDVDSDRLEPLIAIYPTQSLDSLSDFMEAGGRSLQRYLQTQTVTRVVLPSIACLNVNTPEDLDQLDRLDS